MHTQLFDDMQREYNQQLQARRLKRFTARCFLYAAFGVAGLALGGMVAEAHSLLFLLAVLVVVIGGIVSDRYLSTHH